MIKAISSINWFLMVSVLNLDVHQPQSIEMHANEAISNFFMY